MSDIRAGARFTPIEVLWVEEPPGSNYYFAVGELSQANRQRLGGKEEEEK